MRGDIEIYGYGNEKLGIIYEKGKEMGMGMGNWGLQKGKEKGNGKERKSNV